ncbi:hypothetical protein ACJJTC_009966 [Scirpophaga incertulas]
MDPSITTSMEALHKLIESRMQKYEDKLLQVTANSNSKIAPPIDVTSLASEFYEFKSFVWEAMSAIKNQLELLSQGFDKHETAMRRKILHILIYMFVIDLEVQPPVKTSPVLVRFHCFEHRCLAWNSKSSLKGSGITISEFLTKARHSAFLAARKHFGVNKCWSMQGSIHIILPNNTRVKIETISQLQPLITKFPSTSSESETTKIGETQSPNVKRIRQKTAKASKAVKIVSKMPK